MFDISAAIDAAFADAIADAHKAMVLLDAELAALRHAPRPLILTALEAELAALQAQNRLLKRMGWLEAERAALQERYRVRQDEFAALRAQNPLLLEAELVTLQAKKQEAELVRLDEEDRRAHEYEYLCMLRREQRTLDEELLALGRHERVCLTEDEYRPEADSPPEDLQETWRREVRLSGYDPAMLDRFGQTSGRMPSLDEIEDDHSSELP